MIKKRNAEFLTLTEVNKGVRFYHLNDELVFHEWLGRIPCVDGTCGDGRRGLVVHLKRAPRQDELRELIALFYRYGVNMRQLAKFETARNRAWFRDPIQFWHDAVFGSPSGRVTRHKDDASAT